jgi:integrase
MADEINLLLKYTSHLSHLKSKEVLQFLQSHRLIPTSANNFDIIAELLCTFFDNHFYPENAPLGITFKDIHDVVRELSKHVLLMRSDLKTTANWSSWSNLLPATILVQSHIYPTPINLFLRDVLLFSVLGDYQNFKERNLADILKLIVEKKSVIPESILKATFLSSEIFSLRQKADTLIKRLDDWRKGLVKDDKQVFALMALLKHTRLPLEVKKPRKEESAVQKFYSNQVSISEGHYAEQLLVITGILPDESPQLSVTDQDLENSFHERSIAEIERDRVDEFGVERVLLVEEISVSNKAIRENYAKRTQINDINEAQFVDNDPRLISPFEYELLIKKLHDSFQDGDNIEVALGLALSLFTGAEYQYFSNWPILLNENQPPSSGAFINLGSASWTHEIDFHERSFSNEDEQSQSLLPSTKRLTLPLPTILVQLLDRLYRQKFSDDNTGSVVMSDLLGLAQTQVPAMEQFLSSINFNRRMTLAKVRDHLYFQLMNRFFDEPLAVYCVSQPIYYHSAAKSYAAFAESTLKNAYLSLFEDAWKFENVKSQEEVWIGSAMRVNVEYLKAYFQHLGLSVNHAYAAFFNKKTCNLDTLITLHNRYVSYTCLLGFVNTGHRPVKDPFGRACDFVDSLNAVLVMDKIASEHLEARLCFYGEVFARQLINYKNHLRFLGRWLEHFGMKNASKVIDNILSAGEGSAPFLFFLVQEEDSSVRINSLSQSNLISHLPITLNLPLNFSRHLLAQHLAEFGISRELINAQLGHSPVGGALLSDVSHLSAQNLSSVFSSALDVLMEKLDCHETSGLDKMAELRRINENKSTLLLPKSNIEALVRYANYKKKQKRDSALVKEMYERFVLPMSEATLYSKEILTNARKEIASRSSRNLAENLNALNNLTKRHFRKHKIPVTDLKTSVSLTTQETYFSYVYFPLWKKCVDAQKRLNELLRIKLKSTTALSFEEYGSLVICSLVIDSFITHPTRLSKLVTSLLEKKVFHCRLGSFIELHVFPDGDQIERYALASRTAFLVAGFFTRYPDVPQKLNMEGLLKAFELQLRELFLQASLEECWTAINQYAKLKLPGNLAAILRGKHFFASPSHQRFLLLNNLASKSQQKQWQDNIESCLVQQQMQPNALKIFSLKRYKVGSKEHFSQNEKAVRALVFAPSLRDSELRKKLALKLSEMSSSLIEHMILEWALERRYLPGKNKAVLNLSTCEQYYTLLSMPLFDAFKDVELTSLDLEELLEIYAPIIEGIKIEERVNAIVQLTLFHNTQMCSYLSVPSITEDELIAASLLDLQTSGGQDMRVYANALHPAEQSCVEGLLSSVLKGQAIGLDELSLLQLHLIFVLAQGFGTRPNEILRLLVRDINFGTYETSNFILRYSHAHGHLKNDASTRVCFISQGLNTNEFALFTRWFEIRKQETKPLDSFWSLSHARHSPLGVASLLNKSLKLASADAKAERKMLRHHQATRGSHLLAVNERQSLRPLYQLSRKLGHAGPSTTLQHYTHSYEVIAANIFRELSEDYSVDFIANMAAMKPNTVVQIRRRMPSEAGIEEFHHKVLESAFADRAIKVSDERSSFDIVWPKTLDIEEDLPTKIINQIGFYQALLLGKEPRFIELSYGVSPQEQLVALKRYKSLVMCIGFCPLDSVKANAIDWATTTRELIRLLREGELVDVTKSDALDDLYSLWLNYFRPSFSGWHFEICEQYEIAIKSVVDLIPGVKIIYDIGSQPTETFIDIQGRPFVDLASMKEIIVHNTRRARKTPTHRLTNPDAKTYSPELRIDPCIKGFEMKHLNVLLAFFGTIRENIGNVNFLE